MNWVRVFRTSHEWTQAELAERAGISRVELGNIERGVHRPRLQTAQAIAAALDVANVAELFPEEDRAT